MNYNWHIEYEMSYQKLYFFKEIIFMSLSRQIVRDHPIIRTDLQIRIMFAFRLTHPSIPKSEHSRPRKSVNLTIIIWFLGVRIISWTKFRISSFLKPTYPPKSERCSDLLIRTNYWTIPYSCWYMYITFFIHTLFPWLRCKKSQFPDYTRNSNTTLSYPLYWIVSW